MEPRIERRRLQCSRWLLYLAIFLSACVLARLATAAAPAPAPAARCGNGSSSVPPPFP